MSSPQPVVIVAYNEDWPAVFAAAKPRIEQALGPGARIEHVGSTSVPGLGAKAIVDIMVGLPIEDAIDSSVAPLQALGYEYVPEFESEMPYRRYFRMSENGRRTQ